MPIPAIVRNRLKVESTVNNAKRVLELESLDDYLWGFVGGSPIVNRWRKLGDIPAETAESRAMSKDMKKRGFRFVGPTVCYAFMQATGLVNDHVVDCFRFAELSAGLASGPRARHDRTMKDDYSGPERRSGEDRRDARKSGARRRPPKTPRATTDAPARTAARAKSAATTRKTRPRNSSVTTGAPVLT